MNALKFYPIFILSNNCLEKQGQKLGGLDKAFGFANIKGSMIKEILVLAKGSG
jgi:hypothetical protein